MYIQDTGDLRYDLLLLGISVLLGAVHPLLNI